MLSPGDRIGPYRVLHHLASGGMDAVYACVDDRGLRVAVKLPRASDDAVTVARFERGARIAASLTHPRIVAVRGLGRDGGVPWLALELLEGEDLARRMARAPLSPAEAVAVVARACEALAFAHARRVVHRDLTPANLFLRAGSELDVCVLDFGIARADGERVFTTAAQPVGTLPYMAPEQVRGERDLDARADVWSLGVILYECLAGRRPFEADNVYATVYQIVAGDPPPLASLRPDLPADLVVLVHACLARDRRARVEGAAQLRSSLEALTLDEGRAGAAVPLAAEAWLATVVCAAGLRDAAAFEARARALGAVPLRLAGDDVATATFGGTRWEGDEPQRAARLAAEAVVFSRGVGVATGRDDDVLARAASLARAADGVRYDDASAAAVQAAARVEHATVAGGPEGPFVARELETALLVDAALAARDRGAAQAVVVLGAPGLGRSRLATRALGALVERAPSLRPRLARCDAARRGTALAVVDDLLGLGARDARADADPQAALDRARAELSAALADDAARGGCALVALDDAQWLDAASREVLRQVVDDAEAPLALWVTATPDARDAMAALAPSATTRELGPLSALDARRLLELVAPGVPAEAAEAIVQRAEGHPLFLEELARAWRDEGRAEALPASVEGALQGALHRLARDERDFLRCAAVFGRSAWAEGAAALGADPEALTALRRAGHVTPRARARLRGAREFSFRSGLMQEVALALWPDDARAAAHARAAHWLAAQEGSTPDEVARHWDLAGDPARAGALYADAAELAARVAGTVALEHAERALARTRDASVRWRALLARDTALQIDGDRALQARGVEALEALAPELGVEAMAEAAWRRCYLARMTSRLDEARASATLAIDLADGLDAARVGVQARVELALMEANEGRWAEADRLAREAVARAPRTGDDWLSARAAMTLGYVHGEVGDAQEALGHFDRAAAAYTRAGDRRREAVALANGGATLVRLGRMAEALERLDAAIELSRRVGNASTIAMAHQNRAGAHRALGLWERSRADVDVAERTAQRLRRVRVEAHAAIDRAYLELATGASPEALAAACRRATELAGRARSPNLVASARAVTLRAQARTNTVDAALRDEARRGAGGEAAMAECEAELRVAVWEADGSPAGDAGAVREAVERFVRSVGELDDAETCREMFCRRYLVYAMPSSESL